MSKPRWYHLAILLLLLLISLPLRLRGLTRYSIWRDETWAVYLATGRGDLIFNVPFNTIITNPPNVGFTAAPHWWHIWNTLDGVAHPPGYYLALRWWIDLFGQSDGSIRAMSLLFGVAGIVVLFDAMRIAHGPWPALAGAAMMTFAPIQIDFCQQARPYTMAVFLGLMICDFLLRIQRRGISAPRVIGLAIFTLATALLHYFALGMIAAAALFALIEFPAAKRRRTLTVIAAALLLAALVWTPFIPQSRKGFETQLGQTNHSARLSRSTIDAPERLLFGNSDSPNRVAALGPAILIYLLPIIDRRKLLWWLWTIFSLGGVFLIDLYRHSVLLEIERYIFIASAAVYALAAIPLPGKFGWLIPLVVLFGVIAAGLQRFVSGPTFSEGSVYLWEEDRYSAAFLKDHLQPGDLVVLTTNLINYAEFRYLAIAHYDGQWKTPFVLVKSPIDADLEKQLFAFKRVWVVGQDPAGDTHWLFPGTRCIDDGVNTAFDSVWQIKPINSPAP